jgi:hypothetical protein
MLGAIAEDVEGQWVGAITPTHCSTFLEMILNSSSRTIHTN